MKRIYSCEFHAAHHIENHPRCGKTHGHSYQLRVEIEVVKPEDLWIDFHDIADVVDKTVAIYDHTDMGHMTAETLAENLRKEIATEMFAKLAMTVTCSWPIVTVELWETSEFGVRTT